MKHVSIKLNGYSPACMHLLVSLCFPVLYAGLTAVSGTYTEDTLLRTTLETGYKQTARPGTPTTVYLFYVLRTLQSLVLCSVVTIWRKGACVRVVWSLSLSTMFQLYHDNVYVTESSMCRAASLEVSCPSSPTQNFNRHPTLFFFFFFISTKAAKLETFEPVHEIIVVTT